CEFRSRTGLPSPRKFCSTSLICVARNFFRVTVGRLPAAKQRRGHFMSGFDVARSRGLAGTGNASDVSELRDRLIRKATEVRSLVRAAGAFQISTVAYFPRIQRTKSLLAARSYEAALAELERLEVDLLRVFVGRVAVERRSNQAET